MPLDHQTKKLMRIIFCLTLAFFISSCNDNKMTLNQNNNFGQALISDRPSDELGEHADYYKWLIGGWDVKAIDYLSADQRMEAMGEWYFSWVLEGRAVQDVWIAPKRELRTKETSKIRNRYGSTIRTFNFITKTWTITWFNPVSGACDKLTAKKDGFDIVQTGTDNDGNIMKWVFTDITADSFRWYGERSTDGGQTWNLEAEFFGRRKM
jgi:hypothetical protein